MEQYYLVITNSTDTDVELLKFSSQKAALNKMRSLFNEKKNEHETLGNIMYDKDNTYCLDDYAQITYGLEITEMRIGKIS